MLNLSRGLLQEGGAARVADDKLAVCSTAQKLLQGAEKQVSKANVGGGWWWVGVEGKHQD